MTRYRSEIGASFVLIYAFLAWRLGWPLLRALSTGQPVSIGLILASTLTLGGIAYLFGTTSYTLTADSLVVRCGPFSTVVALRAIQKLRATRTLLSSPAWSLNRIEVLASPGPWVVISPADQQRFLKDLLARAPQVQLEGLTLETTG